jgi:hypothetical protein
VLLTLSPLCADLESLNILAKEIASGLDREVESPSPQFADVAEWQREELSADAAEPGRAFWSQQAAAQATGRPLPGERAPEAASSFSGRECHRDIEAGVWLKIQRLADDSGTHPQAWLLACWQILMARLTGESSVVVHGYGDGRTLEELADAVGPLGRYVPLRTTIDANATVRQVA